MSHLISHFEKRAARLRDCATLEVSERHGATTHRLVPHTPGAVGVVLYLGYGGIGTVSLDDPASVPAELGDDVTLDLEAIDSFIDLAVEGRATAFRLGRGGCVEERSPNHDSRTWNDASPWPGWRRRASPTAEHGPSTSRRTLMVAIRALHCRRSPGGRMWHISRRRTTWRTLAPTPNLAHLDQGPALFTRAKGITSVEASRLRDDGVESAGLVRRLLQELSGRLEAQPFVHRHCLPTRVDRHAKGPEVGRVLRSSLHECRADPLASLLRHDEDALDVCGQPTCRSRSRDPRDERDPGHADDLRSKKSSNER
jgi:hypothetical protein